MPEEGREQRPKRRIELNWAFSFLQLSLDTSRIRNVATKNVLLLNWITF